MQKRFDQTKQFDTELNQNGVELGSTQPYRALDGSNPVAATDPSIGDIYATTDKKFIQRIGVFYTDMGTSNPYTSLKASESHLS